MIMSNCLSSGVGKFSIIFSINYSYINSHFHFTKKKKTKQNKTKNKKQKQNKTKNQKSKPINLVQVQQTTPQRKQSFSLN